MITYPPNTVHLYVARRHDGFFSCGADWMMNLSRARFHHRPGPAKAAATKWAKKNPGQPVPQLLSWVLTVDNAEVQDISAQTKKRITRAEIRRMKQEDRRVQQRLADLAAQEKRLEEERERLMEGKR